MNEAERAYEAALSKIVTAKAENLPNLDLSHKAYKALAQIPSAILQYEGLASLNLRGTNVTDVSALAALKGIKTLVLSETGVTDISPLSETKNLESVHLASTEVLDISPLAKLSQLRTLVLRDTAVADISSLESAKNLVDLDISKTRVSDVSSLSKCRSLGDLRLSNTAVSDISPLKSLQLYYLDLTQAPIIDLRPIKDLTSLATFDTMSHFSYNGFQFSDTLAVRADGELLRLSKLPEGVQRTKDVIAYLHTLPPWPEPYTPATSGDGSPPRQIGGQLPEILAGVRAPVEVIEVDGRLVRAAASDELDVAGRDLAEEGWQALRDHLEDLGALRPKIDNQMPQLARALDRFDRALGTTYAAVRPIAVGTHGMRVVAMAGQPADTLADADVAELRAFAGTIMLFLDRFPAWRAYRDDPAPAPVPPDDAAAGAAGVEEIAAALAEQPAVDSEVANALTDLARAVEGNPADPVAQKGLARSASNVLGALARKALTAGRWTMRKAGGFPGLVVDEGLKIAAKGIATPLLGAALDIFFNKAKLLYALAAQFPETLGWLGAVLRFLGI